MNIWFSLLPIKTVNGIPQWNYNAEMEIWLKYSLPIREKTLLPPFLEWSWLPIEKLITEYRDSDDKGYMLSSF